MLTKGVMYCLKYIEVVPWSEEGEEKLRILFTRFNFDYSTTRDILERLYSHDPTKSQRNLATQLVWFIINGSNSNAWNELRGLDMKALATRDPLLWSDMRSVMFLPFNLLRLGLRGCITCQKWEWAWFSHGLARCCWILGGCKDGRERQLWALATVATDAVGFWASWESGVPMWTPQPQLPPGKQKSVLQ